MRRLLSFSVRHPRTVVGLLAAATVAACFFIPRVKLQLDARSLIPVDNQRLVESDRAARMFGLRDVVVVGVANEASGVYTPATLSRIARLGRGLAGVEGIDPNSVVSLVTTPRLLVENDRIDARLLLAPGAEPDEDAARLVRREAERMGLNDGLLVSPDGRAAAVYAEVQPQADRYEVLRQVRELAARESGGADAVHLSGTALAQAVLGHAAAADLLRLVPLVIVVLGVFLTLSFRHPVPALISLAEIGCSLILTAGLMGLTGRPVFITTMVMPVILIAVGVSDDVYALRHYFGTLRRAGSGPAAEAVTSAFGEIIRPIGLTAVTTVVGLLSLAATSLEPLRVFGIFGAIAIGFSSLFTLTLVPALLVLLKPGASSGVYDGGGAKWAGRMSSLYRLLNAAGPRFILPLSLLLALGAALLTTRLRVDDSWVRNLPGDSDILRGDQSLNRLMAGTTRLDFLLDGARRDSILDPQVMASLGALEDSVAKLPFVGAVHSIYSDVVRVNASLRGARYGEFREALRRGAVKLGREDIEQALLLLSSMSRDPTDAWVDGGHRRARVNVTIRFADYERIHSVLRTAEGAGLNLDAAGGPVVAFGDGWISYLTVQLLVEGQVRSILLALLVDLLLLSLLFRSGRCGLIAVTPVAFSVFVVFAMLAASGVPLGIANSMFASIAIGIGMDFSIHLTSSYQTGVNDGHSRREAMKAAFLGTGPSILISAGAITLGFLVLALSQVAPNVQLGLMICLSLSTCAAATLVLVPGLALLRSPFKMKLKQAYKAPLCLLAALLPYLLAGCGTPSAGAPQRASAADEAAAAPAEEARVLDGPQPVEVEKVSEAQRPDPSGLVRAYNARNLGSPGLRGVTLELITEKRLTRSFTVYNFWKRERDGVRTLFLLKEPRGLGGTSYLLTENETAAPDMSVRLFLPAGLKRVLEIPPTNYEEGLLGSDFTYNDLRMQLPTRGYRHRLAGKSVLRGQPVWVVEALPGPDAATTWRLVRFYLARDFDFLLGADYFGGAGGGAGEPTKRMRVESYRQHDGVWTADRMVMYNANDRASVLSLKDAQFARADLPARFFKPEEMPALADEVRQGGSLESLVSSRPASASSAASDAR